MYAPAGIDRINSTYPELFVTTDVNAVLSILNRRDKMGFPVPLKEWFASELHDFVLETVANMKAKNRDFVDTDAVLRNFGESGQFSRKTWALLSLELWQQEFHDKAAEYRALLK